MPKITRDSLLTLEAYSKERDRFRKKIIEHKKNRTISLGEHITLFFEDELTMRYQVQEMLRAEKIFEEDEIRNELDAYNPLIPDGNNFKATLMIEYADATERQIWLAELKGIEHRIWIEIKGYSPVYAIADEDLERENSEKTSAVHFLRFELTPAMKKAFKEGINSNIGIDHPAYPKVNQIIPLEVRAALINDLD